MLPRCVRGTALRLSVGLLCDHGDLTGRVWPVWCGTRVSQLAAEARERAAQAEAQQARLEELEAEAIARQQRAAAHRRGSVVALRAADVSRAQAQLAKVAVILEEGSEASSDDDSDHEGVSDTDSVRAARAKLQDRRDSLARAEAQLEESQRRQVEAVASARREAQLERAGRRNSGGEGSVGSSPCPPSTNSRRHSPHAMRGIALAKQFGRHAKQRLRRLSPTKVQPGGEANPGKASESGHDHHHHRHHHHHHQEPHEDGDNAAADVDSAWHKVFDESACALACRCACVADICVCVWSASERYYYFNTVSRQSLWQPPQAWLKAHLTPPSMAPPPPPRVAAVADPSRASAPTVDTGLGVTSDGDDDALSVDSDEAAQLVAAVESLPDVGLNEDDDDPSPQLGLVADEVAALMSKQEGVCAVPSIPACGGSRHRWRVWHYRATAGVNGRNRGVGR